MSIRIVLLLLLGLFWIGVERAVGASNATGCFYPDGQPAVDFKYESCGKTPGATFSSCCNPSEGDKCIQELGLCFFPPVAAGSGYGAYLYRGGCTDKSWEDPACSRICFTNNPNRFETVGYCSKTDDFCCPKSVTTGGDCCDDPALRFQLKVEQEIRIQLQMNVTVVGPLQRPSGTTLSSPTTSPAGSNSTTGDKPTMSTREIVVISVLVTLIAVISGALLICLCARRTRRRQRQADGQINHPVQAGGVVPAIRQRMSEQPPITVPAPVHRRSTRSIPSHIRHWVSERSDEIVQQTAGPPDAIEAGQAEDPFEDCRSSAEQSIVDHHGSTRETILDHASRAGPSDRPT